jgi:hypothetical protein
MKNKALEALDTLIGRAPENQKEKMRLSVMTVTPKMAEKFLSVNHVNRQVRPRNVLYWVSAIMGDAVPLTHQGIAITGTIDNPKRLIDGQHRCLAIIETGRSVNFVVSENTPEEAYACVDNGMPRSMADRAGISPDEAQMCNSLFYMSISGFRAKPPVKLIQELHQLIHPWLKYVVNKKRRSLSVVPIRLAFLLQQKVYKTNYSEEFQEGKFGVLPESMNALYRRQSTRPFVSTGGHSQMALFCATWRAIMRPSNSKIYMPSAPLEEARNTIHAVFPEIGQLFDEYKIGINTKIQ